MDFEPHAYGQLADASTPEWVRGRARLDGGAVVLEPSEPFRAWEREQELGRSLLGDLLDIRDAGDVLAFAREWGLLWHGPDATEHRERIADWLGVADELRAILQIYAALQASMGSRSPDATERLRERLRACVRIDERRLPSDVVELDVERRAAMCVMALLNRGLGTTRSGVISTGLLTYPMEAADGDAVVARGQPSHFYFMTFFEDLVGYAYQTLARHIVERHELYECHHSGCGTVKPRLHGNQKYCSDRCESAAREERRRERKATAG